jgi:hypothetical protein
MTEKEITACFIWTSLVILIIIAICTTPSYTPSERREASEAYNRLKDIGLSSEQIHELVKDK